MKAGYEYMLYLYKNDDEGRYNGLVMSFSVQHFHFLPTRLEICFVLKIK
jgi:hypothetical protein